MDKGKHLSYIDSYKKFKASRICVQWCIIIGLLIYFFFKLKNFLDPKGLNNNYYYVILFIFLLYR